MYTICKRPSPMSQKTLGSLFVLSICMWLGFGSCNYHERFIISINEGNTFPCVGVIHFSFILEAAEHGQVPLTSESRTASFEDSQLYWNKQTGRCQIPEGILLKDIPYGGERKITIQGFDSTHYIRQPIAMGTSPRFLLEASGSDVTENISLNLIRGCKQFDEVQGTCGNKTNISLGTLIIRFPNTALVPQATKSILFQMKAITSQNIPEVTRQINVDTSAGPPNHIILTNMPPANKRPFTIYALGVDPVTKVPNSSLKRWSGQYTLSTNITPQTATQRIQAGAAQ